MKSSMKKMKNLGESSFYVKPAVNNWRKALFFVTGFLFAEVLRPKPCVILTSEK